MSFFCCFLAVCVPTSRQGECDALTLSPGKCREMSSHLLDETSSKAFEHDCEGLCPSHGDSFFKDKKEVEACVAACDRAARAIADLYDD